MGCLNTQADKDSEYYQCLEDIKNRLYSLRQVTSEQSILIDDIHTHESTIAAIDRGLKDQLCERDPEMYSYYDGTHIDYEFDIIFIQIRLFLDYGINAGLLNDAITLAEEADTIYELRSSQDSCFTSIEIIYNEIMTLIERTYTLEDQITANDSIKDIVGSLEDIYQTSYIYDLYSYPSLWPLIKPFCNEWISILSNLNIPRDNVVGLKSRLGEFFQEYRISLRDDRIGHFPSYYMDPEEKVAIDDKVNNKFDYIRGILNTLETR